MNQLKENIRDCNGGKQRYLSFGRKAVKLSATQKDFLKNIMPLVEIPLGDGIIDISDYFKVDGPLHLEIGFGSGEYTASLAKAYPDHRIIACEIFLNGISGLLQKIDEDNIENIRIINGSAVMALEQMFADKSFDYIHINHPDPWPKKRHHKRRMIQPHILELISKALKPWGEVWLSTDVYEYYEWMKECFDSSKLFQNIPTVGRFLDDADTDKITTRYEAKGEIHGRATRHLRYKKLL